MHFISAQPCFWTPSHSSFDAPRLTVGGGFLSQTLGVWRPLESCPPSQVSSQKRAFVVAGRQVSGSFGADILVAGLISWLCRALPPPEPTRKIALRDQLILNLHIN